MNRTSIRAAIASPIRASTYPGRLLLPAALLSLGLALASPARADVAVLRDGRRLDGVVSVEGDQVVVRRRYGEVRVPHADVLRIEETHDPWDELERLRAQLAGGSADERYRFAVFCRGQGFEEEARGAFLSVLAVDLNHAGARAALGYVLHEGHWVTVADRNRALGLVEHRGQWITPERKAELVAEAERAAEARRQERDAERERRQQEREAEKQAERERRQARIQAYEEELAKARARQRAWEEANPSYGLTSGVWVGGGYVPGWIQWGGWRPRPVPYGLGGGYSGYYQRRCWGSSLSGSYDGGNWGLRWRIGW